MCFFLTKFNLKMDQLGLADRKIHRAVAMAAIVAGRPIGIDDSVDFVAIAVWPLRYDQFAVVGAVIVVVGHTIVANLTLEGFHDLCGIPV